MSILSRLFGGSKPSAVEQTAEEYQGFRIFSCPAKVDGGFRIGARIEKEVDGETMVHDLIRADTIASKDEAETVSVSKAKQVIDEQGDRLFR